MATDEEDLRLNTLHRFQKHSPRLTLQVHSHCEVPAGCGGVVLRWVNPDAGFGAVIHVQPGEGAEAWVDGARVTTTLLTLSYGEHLLALRVVPVAVTVRSRRPKILGGGDRTGRPFVCAVTSDGPRFPATAPATASSHRGWRASPTSSPAWTEPGFDDRAWKDLGASALDVERSDSNLRWRIGSLVRDTGAQVLELPDAPEVFIRHRFQVSR